MPLVVDPADEQLEVAGRDLAALMTLVCVLAGFAEWRKPSAAAYRLWHHPAPRTIAALCGLSDPRWT
jgi:hypothetical protein